MNQSEFFISIPTVEMEDTDWFISLRAIRYISTISYHWILKNKKNCNEKIFVMVTRLIVFKGKHDPYSGADISVHSIILNIIEKIDSYIIESKSWTTSLMW